MTAKVKFFAQFREFFGTDIAAETTPEVSFRDLIQRIVEKNREGYDAIFDAKGAFRDFVILMKNGERIEGADAAKTIIHDGDEIAVFPPVAGG